jgi:hypothetical protein
METHATITASRGDRPEFFAFCITQLNKMSAGKPLVNSYLMNERPLSNDVDIVPRIKNGIRLADKDGFKWVFCIEEDDWYPSYYFSLFDLSNYDFVGFSTTTYYNIKARTWQKFKHPGRSSLFCTGFRISALSDNFWNRIKDTERFLDIKIWEEANRTGAKMLLMPENPCIGIKHGLGKTGGKGHIMQLENRDPEMKWLRDHTDEEAFEFYKDLRLKL